jgi:hypothetical protein
MASEEGEINKELSLLCWEIGKCDLEWTYHSGIVFELRIGLLCKDHKCTSNLGYRVP